MRATDSQQAHYVVLVRSVHYLDSEHCVRLYALKLRLKDDHSSLYFPIGHGKTRDDVQGNRGEKELRLKDR